MMYYLNKASDVNDAAKRNPGWYLQNFGHAGWSTVDVLNHLKRCLSSPAYFTGKSFVVNVGGNNWVYASIFIKANPWVGFLVNVYTRNDVNDILIRLGGLASIDENTKKKRVLLLGNYPAFAGGIFPAEDSKTDAVTISNTYNATTTAVGAVKFFLTIKSCTSCSFRAISKIAAILEGHFNLQYGIPSHNTVLLWLKKIGYYRLMQAKETALDWVLIIDESIQFGREKLLVIYGIRESSLPSDRAIRFTDLVPMLIKANTNWNGESIKKEILGLKKKLGEIVYAVCDHGSDIKKALRLSGIRHIHDITHHAALIQAILYQHPNTNN